MGDESVSKFKLSRRDTLLGGAVIGSAAPSPVNASPTKFRQPDILLETPQGILKVTAVNDRAFRVLLEPLSRGLGNGAHTFESDMLLPQTPAVKVHLSRRGTSARLEIAHAVCDVDTQNGQVRIFDKKGNLLLSETAGGRTIESVELSDGPINFLCPDDDRLPDGISSVRSTFLYPDDFAVLLWRSQSAKAKTLDLAGQESLD